MVVTAFAWSERAEQQQQRGGFSSSRAHQLPLPITTTRQESGLLRSARLLLLCAIEILDSLLGL